MSVAGVQEENTANRVDTILSQKLLCTKGHYSKNVYPRVMVLALCTSSNVS